MTGLKMIGLCNCLITGVRLYVTANCPITTLQINLMQNTAVYAPMTFEEIVMVISSDIWHEYHKWYFKIVIVNFRSLDK